MGRIAFITCVIVLLATAGGRCADVKEELQGINREIREKKLLLKKNRKVETQVSSDLEKSEKKLREKEASLAALQQDMKNVESSLESTGREIEKVRDEADRKRRQIRLRLASLYKAGEIGGVRIFFSSESLPQTVENMRYMKAVLAHDKGLFADYNSRVERLKTLKLSLEADAQRKERIRRGIELTKRELEADRKEKSAYLVKLREDKKGYLASLKELEANARRLQRMIERLEAKSRRGYTVKKENKQVLTAPSLPPAADKGFGSQKGRLAMPAKGEVIGRFGRHKHPEFNSYTVSNGISIAAQPGSEVHSVYGGQVIFADYFKGYGNMVIIDHGGGFFSLYAHAARIIKKVGAAVGRNEVVATVGDVDSSRGPMLYFEIRYQGKPVDPSPWLR